MQEVVDQMRRRKKKKRKKEERKSQGFEQPKLEKKRMPVIRGKKVKYSFYL